MTTLPSPDNTNRMKINSLAGLTARKSKIRKTGTGIYQNNSNINSNSFMQMNSQNSELMFPFSFCENKYNGNNGFQKKIVRILLVNAIEETKCCCSSCLYLNIK